MAARIQYCSLEEFRKCYMEGVGFKTLGRPQMRTIEARLRKQGKLDKHGKNIQGVTPKSWTDSYVDLTVVGDAETIPVSLPSLTGLCY